MKLSSVSMRRPGARTCLAILISALALANGQLAADFEPALSEERCVIQTSFGDVEFGFWPQVAPITAHHVHRLLSLGIFDTNHFFRVDKGFVVQTADAASGRTVPLNDQQREHASTRVPLEVKEGAKHHEGVLSMARGDDPGSGGSSFFIMLGSAPHLDMKYAAFGKVTRGLDVLHKFEGVATERSGIFVMPKERIAFASTYCFTIAQGPSLHVAGSAVVTGGKGSNAELEDLKLRFENQSADLERIRKKCLPA